MGFQGGYRGGDEPELENLRALHRQAREQRESIWRDRMLADALLAVRDPNAALNLGWKNRTGDEKDPP
jgi:hypothetical protein